MNTTIDLDRMPAAPIWPRRATIRLGVILSATAVLIAVVLRALLGVPTVAILAGVVVAGSVLSWRAAGQAIDRPDA